MSSYYSGKSQQNDLMRVLSARLWFVFSKEREKIQPCWASGFACTISWNWVGSRKSGRTKKSKHLLSGWGWQG